MLVFGSEASSVSNVLKVCDVRVLLTVVLWVQVRY